MSHPRVRRTLFVVPGWAGAVLAFGLGASPWGPVAAVVLSVIALVVPASLAAVALLAAALLATAALPMASALQANAPAVLAAVLLSILPLYLVLGDGKPPLRAFPAMLAAIAAVFAAVVFSGWSPTFLASDAGPRAQALLLAALTLVAHAVAPYVRSPRRARGDAPQTPPAT